MLNLNNLLNNKGEVKQEGSSKNNVVNKATEGQIKFYIDLCNQKSVDINPHHTEWTVNQMSEEINKLLSMKKVVLASQKQIDTIVKLSQQLGMPEPNVDALAKLPINKASEMIELLIKKTNQSDKPTEKQLQMLADMFKCPDVIITDLIPVHPTLIKELDELTVAHKKALENKTKKTVYNGEVTTLKEIQDQIVKTKSDIEKFIVNFDLSTLTKQEVGNFIQDYSEVFYAWRDSRCSPAQKEFIRTLQQRLATINGWSVNIDEIPANIDGSPMYDINTPVKDEVILTGEHILTDDELEQFSKDQASQLIDMLQKELRNKELDKVSDNEPEIDDNIARSLVDITKANEKEQEKIHNMIHSLYAVLGQEADEEILTATDLTKPLTDLIELCALYTTPDALKDLIDQFTQADALLESLNIELE